MVAVSMKTSHSDKKTSNNKIKFTQIEHSLTKAIFPAREPLENADSTELLSVVQEVFSQKIPLKNIPHHLLQVLDAHTFLLRGKRFSSMSEKEQAEFLKKNQYSTVTGPILRALITPLKLAWLTRPEIQKNFNQRPTLAVPTGLENEPWRQKITSSEDCKPQEEMDVDVVIVGSGAGGAAAAYELAAKGLAVMIIEEGKHYDRRDFNSNIPEMASKLYRNFGATGAIGSTFIPIPIGRSVGGTTTINSGTCLRTPENVLKQWQEEGLKELTSEEMEPYFKEVEEIIQVQPAEPRYVGEIAEVIRQGAEANNFKSSHMLQRNAVGCDGQGLCQFGCPTGAKQSTNVSFIPRALDRGAFMMTDYKVAELIWNGDQVIGLKATGTGQEEKKLTINASQVIISMGSLITPHFLQKNGIRLKMLGKNLSIHPAGAVSAYFPDRQFNNSYVIPQGFGVNDLAEEGIMFEGATPPPLGYGLLMPQLGQDYIKKMSQYQQTAFFGFMIKDTTRGRVSNLPLLNQPLVTYSMNKKDFKLFKKGSYLLAKMYLDTGAKEVYIAGLNRYPPVKNLQELNKLFARRLSPRDFFISAFHPLGTARIGISSKQAVCDPSHRVYGTRNLYVMDGSSIPSSLGANPQVTIMAMAMRAARQLAERML